MDATQCMARIVPGMLVFGKLRAHVNLHKQKYRSNFLHFVSASCVLRLIPAKQLCKCTMFDIDLACHIRSRLLYVMT